MTKPKGIPNGHRHAEFVRLSSLDTDQCVEWPYSKNSKGYGLTWIGGKVVTTHSAVCERTHGPRPKGYHAAHYCGNKACLNPKHIRWATPSENELEKQVHKQLRLMAAHRATNGAPLVQSYPKRAV